jgi:DNA-binding response OmpR family regulator
MAPRTVLLITSRPDGLQELTRGIDKEPGLKVRAAYTMDEALAVLADDPPLLAVIDDSVGEVSGLDVVRRLMRIDAFLNTAVLSALDEETFHRRSEGLGILARLPLQPDAGDVARLLEALRRVVPDPAAIPDRPE